MGFNAKNTILPKLLEPTILQTILITGARAPIALEMARSFHQHGHTVIMADSQHFTVARWSNAVKKYCILPSARHETDAYINRLNAIIEAENVTHLIPTCEEAFYIALHKDKINCRVWTSDTELMHSLHNKWVFSQFAALDFPMPKTQLVKDFSDWSRSDAYVFKPIYSRFATGTIIGKKLSENHFSESDKTAWLVQNRIQGKEICIYSIWDNGILKGFAAYHPLYRVGSGAGVFFEPIMHNETFERVKAFGEKIKYTGQLCFDVIIDGADVPYFLECNPRGTSGAHLLNEKLALCYLGQGDLITPTQQAYSIKYAMAILHPFSYFTKTVWAARDVIYKSNDMKPFFLQFLSLFEITFIRFTKQLSWLSVTTADIEWNGNEN